MSLPPSIARLPEQAAELAALLETWANINSGSNHFAGLERMRLALRETFARTFPAARIEDLELPGTAARALRITLRPEAAQRVVLCGHFDTVYEADDAFQSCTRVDEQTLRGPGVSDMKGGIVVLFAALRAFEETPHADRLGWEVLLTPDEEIGSHGSRELFNAAARHNHFGFVFEPARPNGDIVHSRKGTGGFVVTCRGRAGHAAKIPSDARNAVLALAEFLLGASRIPAELPGVLVNVANIHGGGAATNVVPDFAQSEIDVRITKMADRDLLLGRLNALAAGINAREGFSLELKGGFNRTPKECLPAEERVFAEWQRAARDVGVAPFSWVHTGGASDGNLLAAAGLPHLDGLGPVGDHLHSSREFVSLPTLAPRARITALFLHRVAAGEVALR